MSSSSTSRFLPFVFTKQSVISSKLRKIFNSTKLALYSLGASQEQTHDLEWRKSAVGKVEATKKFEDKEYKCRFLTQFSINTLKPEDCHRHVSEVANSKDYTSLPKVHITLSQDLIKIENVVTSSLERDRKFKRNNIITGQNEGKYLRFHNSKVNRIISTNGEWVATKNNQMQTKFKPCCVEESFIPISKIAFCSTVPQRPDVILIIWRNHGNLVCRAFLLSSFKSVKEMKYGIAMRFERTYREWQMQFCRRSFTKKSFIGRKKSSRLYKPRGVHRQLHAQRSSPI